MIYLDNASTTQVFKPVADRMMEIYRKDFFNPSALYAPAQKCKELLNDARSSFAQLFKTDEDEIFFTSCATESNNWAIKSSFKNKKGNFVISAGEHASVYAAANELKAMGCELRIANLMPDGKVNEQDFISKIDNETCLVSVIHCSNETGVLNDIKTLTNIAKKINPKIIFHSDGVQALSKTCNSLPHLGVDLYSASAHKVGGAKGTGLLYIKKSLNLRPFLSGGGQEKGMRSGTENVAGIVGFALAAKEFKAMSNEASLKLFKKIIIDKLKAKIDDFVINGNQEDNSGYILSLSFKSIKAEVLMHLMCDDEVLIGLGSACSSKSSFNRTLNAMGVKNEFADGSIRISFSPENTVEEIEDASDKLVKNILKLRGIKIG